MVKFALALVLYLLTLLVLYFFKIEKLKCWYKCIENELAYLLKDFPGYLALSVTDESLKSSTTIMSFIQAQKNENVLYMVSDKKASKIYDLKKNPLVSFTTWFDSLENGGRLSSNRVKSEVLGERQLRSLLRKNQFCLS
ncbi:hypothetical protein QK908_05870 [Lactococcus cremoris]